MKKPLRLLTVPGRLIFHTRKLYSAVYMYEKDGKVRYDQEFFCYSHEPYPCYSASKSTVSVALGVLYDRGLFRPSDKIYDYLSEFFPEGFDPKWKEVTIDDILHHRTGTADAEVFDGGCSDFDEGEFAWDGKEILTKLFRRPITETPGTVFHYQDANYYILARLAEKLSGMNVLRFLVENVFTGMGFMNYAWVSDPNGHVMGGTGLMLRTVDYAKMGWLWLHKGVYEGKRYFSEEWANMALTASVDRTNNAHYGYGIRRLSETGYSITGAFGQGLYFDINKNFVYAWHARKGNQMMTICEIINKLFLK